MTFVTAFPYPFATIYLDDSSRKSVFQIRVCFSLDSMFQKLGFSEKLQLVGAFSSFLVGSRASRMSLVYLFDFVTVTATTVTGWCAIAAFFLTSIAGSVYMLYLIVRAKKCLDFAATLYIIHLSICTVYGGWPSSVTWWVVNVTGFAVMALLGEYLCIRREMREIPITRYG